MTSPLIAALRDPAAVRSWSVPQWERLIRQARSADLLSRLAHLLAETAIPPGPRRHLVAAQVTAGAQAEAVQREVAHVARALASTGVDVILLKGAAYLLAGLPVSRGRVFNDVDVLVPREALPRVEAALMLHGWAGSHHHPHDQRYYREWMHELPPLRHLARESVLDVHHAIAPLTGRFRPDSAKLIAAARALEGQSRLKVLAPLDMVLHAAAHLFLNEELTHGLRDLADLDALLRDFAREASFWSALEERAHELDLSLPLQYALRYCARLLATPVPEQYLKDSIPVWKRGLLDALYLRALQPHHPDASDRFTPLARALLYLRGHWLRLPPHLLLYHLTVKALRKRPEEPLTQGR